MEALRERPPDYTARDPDSIILPSVPRTDPPATSPPLKLPDLKSLHLLNNTISTRPAPLQNLPAHQQWASVTAPSSQQPGGFRLPPPTPLYSSTFGPLPSPMETDSVMSENRMRQHSIVSLDDPETREAAETLSGLRNNGRCLFTPIVIQCACICSIYHQDL
jgi:transcriptional repressor OPI1